MDHRPLCLSPDIVWLMIIQGVANHINANADELRPKLVSHLGKPTIEVRRDDFVKGSPENPWPEVFSEFSTQIRDHVGASIEQFVPAFSTTGPVERAAAEVVLLDGMRSYFEYVVRLPAGLSTAPFRWDYLDRSFNMEFLGGFVGVAQDQETLTLRPEIGWAVREAPAVG